MKLEYVHIQSCTCMQCSGRDDLYHTRTTSTRSLLLTYRCKELSIFFRRSMVLRTRLQRRSLSVAAAMTLTVTMMKMTLRSWERSVSSVSATLEIRCCYRVDISVSARDVVSQVALSLSLSLSLSIPHPFSLLSLPSSILLSPPLFLSLCSRLPPFLPKQ